MGQIILPLLKKACCGLFNRKKIDGFGQDRTGDIGLMNVSIEVTGF
jgi:hypothetical protein